MRAQRGRRRPRQCRPHRSHRRAMVVARRLRWRRNSQARTKSAFRSGGRSHFTLKAADVIHSFWVPSLGGKVDMIPGRTTGLRLTAERQGIYRGQCAEYCGGPHALMAFEVVAMPPAEYDAWLAREAAPARAPSSEQEQRGQSLFIAAGCGACHAVRGTAAAGIDRTRSHAHRKPPLGRHRHAAAHGGQHHALHRARAARSSRATACPSSASSRPTSTPRSPPIC